MKPPVVMLVDDEEELRHSATQALDLEGLAVEAFASAEDALAFVTQGFNGVIVSDIRMPGMDGMTMMNRVHEIDADLPFIVVTGHADVELAVRAMHEGAYDFIEKPFDIRRVSETVRRGMDRRQLVLENRQLRAVAGKRDDVESRMPGRTQAMVDLRYKLRAVAATDADLLIVGDTGTGKEVAARAIHDLSVRSGRPLVAINCAALPENLIESELFGHEAGAFPGALRQRFGKFEHARGGAILLDEIGSMPLELQAKMLRVLQDRVITRLGSNEPIELDVRFIALSKVDLTREVNEGRFRADLLYRLNAITLQIPSLAQRREDIPLLFHQLVREAAARYRKDDVPVDKAVAAAIAQREWPGNVRELRNEADRHVLGLAQVETTAVKDTDAGLAESMAAYERMLILQSLARHRGRLKHVYEALGISRKTLYEKMQRHGISRSDLVDDQD